AQQVLPRPISGGEVKVSHAAGHPAVNLFGEGGVLVAGTQTGFYVSCRDSCIEGGERGRHGGGSVTVNKHQVGPGLGQDTPETDEDTGGHVGQVLPRPHDVQVVVWTDVEDVQHLIEHLTMLGSDTNLDFEPVRVFLQLPDQRRHFYGLGSGAEYQ